MLVIVEGNPGDARGVTRRVVGIFSSTCRVGPVASYQCTSARTLSPLTSRTSALPLRLPPATVVALAQLGDLPNSGPCRNRCNISQIAKNLEVHAASFQDRASRVKQAPAHWAHAAEVPMMKTGSVP